jgi:hypothetical protein
MAFKELLAGSEQYVRCASRIQVTRMAEDTGLQTERVNEFRVVRKESKPVNELAAQGSRWARDRILRHLFIDESCTFSERSLGFGLTDSDVESSVET